MLRDIYIIKDMNILYHIQFGTSYDWDMLCPIIQKQFSYMEVVLEDKVEFLQLGNFRLTYSTDFKKKLIFIFLSDLTNSQEDLEKQILKAQEEFITMFEDFIVESMDKAVYTSFNPVAEMIHQNLRPKIALIGFPGVGKTTIVKLIRAEEIPMEHIPTVTGDISTIKIGKLYFYLWDFAGQDEYSFLWPAFLRNSDAVLVISDSTLENIDKSKFFLDLIKKEVPEASLSVIANKQDIVGALNPEKVEKLLGVKSYGMIAIDPENRAKMFRIIAELLNLSPQISPLIQPLIKRDKEMEEAETYLIQGDFEKAIQKFKNIATLSRELGDDKVSLEFFERAKLLESQIQQQKVKFFAVQNEKSKLTQSTELAQEEAPPIILKSQSIPKIIDNSQPIHPKPPYSDFSPFSQFIDINIQFNLIDRNIDSIFSNNYLQINFNKYNKKQITEIFTNFSEISLLDFISNAKTQINYSTIQLFPDFTIQTTTKTKSASNVEKSVKASKKEIRKILKDKNKSSKEKIELLKKELNSIDEKTKEFDNIIEKGNISQIEYDKTISKIRELKNTIQEKISDLRIQEIKEFDLSLPE
ncbi:MAG: ADP-ribosylation factor-like protein [Promethearchaeota archaeon]